MSETNAVNPISEEGVNLETSLVTQDTPDSQNDAEVLQSVDELMELVQNKFSKISSEVLSKMDEMAQRLNELEVSIKAGTTEPDTEPDLTDLPDLGDPEDHRDPTDTASTADIRGSRDENGGASGSGR